MRRPAGWHCERGTISVLVVGIFLILLLFVGMSVDFGIFLRYRRAMQNACDSGALAGALNIRRDPATVEPTALRYAEGDMRQNNIAWSSLTAATYDRNWQPALIGADRVRVEIHADVPTYFLRLIRDSVHVAVDCAAKLTPIILSKGLVPIGLDYSKWFTLYDPTNPDAPCAAYVKDGVPLDQRPEPCRSFAMTVDISAKDNPWGSGNTGLLSMSCFDCPSGGGAQWRDYFINGAPTSYCYDPNRTADATDYALNGQPCANVKTEPGVKIGPISQAVDERCASPPPPDSLDRIIMMPLLNPAYVDGGQGTYTTEIWGFVAFEIDCANTNFTGADPTIEGGFVSLVSMQAYGQETEFDTGVYTVKLIE